MSKTIEEQVEEFDHFLQNSGNEVSWGAIDKKMTAILQERERIAREEAIKECEGCVPEEKIISKIKAGCMREGVRGQKRHQAVTRAYGHNSCREQTLQAISKIKT